MKKTVYLQLEPRWNSNYRKSKGDPPDGCAPVAVFANLPKGKPGLVVELELDIDASLFMPVKPRVEVKLERDTQPAQVQVVGNRVKSQTAREMFDHGKP